MLGSLSSRLRAGVRRLAEARRERKKKLAEIEAKLVKHGVPRKDARRLAKRVLSGELTVKGAVKLGREIERRRIRQLLGGGARRGRRRKKKRRR